jgi:hypothetical protein
MAIRTVEIACLLNYNQRAEWNKQNSPLIASECSTVAGVEVGEGITIRTYKLVESGQYTSRNWQSSLADALFYVKSDTVKHVGQTVEVYSKVERIMSDVWDDVWYSINYDAANMTFITERLPHCGSHAVDATDEVKAIYAAFKDGTQLGHAFASAENYQARRVAEELAEKRRITKGKVVRVVKGRKVPKGTQGEVFWMRNDVWGMRLGIATSDRRDARGNWADVAWVAADNVAVIDAAGNVI